MRKDRSLTISLVRYGQTKFHQSPTAQFAERNEKQKQFSKRVKVVSDCGCEVEWSETERTESGAVQIPQEAVCDVSAGLKIQARRC
jgi:hypothetical protein